MRLGDKRAALVLALLHILVAKEASAWPLFVPFSEVSRLAGVPKGALIGFVRSASGWRRVPFQVDQKSATGDRLQWQPDFEDPRRKEFYGGAEAWRPNLSVRDEVVMDSKLFEPCDKNCQESIFDGVEEVCQGRQGEFGRERPVIEVRIEGPARSAFIASCDKSPEPIVSAVRWNRDEHRLESSGYSYTYNAGNSLLLDEFALKEGEGTLRRLLEKSSFTLHAKPKFFFPLTFTGDDVTSELMSFSSHPLSSTGELSFRLRVLMFKIRMDLLSSISMYRDAIEVPAILTLPVSGSMLREGSGVLYGFRFAGSEFLKAVNTDMPWLPPPGNEIEFKNSRTFSLVQGESAVVAAVRMPHSFKKMGFSPALATDRELKAWEFPETGSDFGIFYDITKLRKGRHRLEVWFLTGKASERAEMERIAVEGFRATYAVHFRKKTGQETR